MIAASARQEPRLACVLSNANEIQTSASARRDTRREEAKGKPSRPPPKRDARLARQTYLKSSVAFEQIILEDGVSLAFLQKTDATQELN